MAAQAPVEFTKEIIISATPSLVWQALTVSVQMAAWMAETPIEIRTTWQVGSPIIIQGPWYKTGFVNKGFALAYEPEQTLQYSHLSSLSHLPDEPASYTILSFRLVAKEGKTQLTFTATNFPTEVIYRHFAFYWNVALELLKKYVEQDAGATPS